MTYVCYYQCDRCGTRVDTDLTPEGWDIGHVDLCPECYRKAKGRRDTENERR